jgi:hypothetical protein
MKFTKTGLASSLAVILCFIGCSEPKRPVEATADATRVEGAKTGYWQICSSQRTRVHCTVWNDSGTVLKDETYLPFDKGPTPQEADLKIRPGQICSGRSGPYEVCLINGRILLPESQFDQIKNFLKP